MTGSVNNDALLWPICAGVFLVLARCFRRGLTVKRGAAIGALVAAGVLTKGSMFGFLPGIGLAFLLMIWRAPREQRRRALLAAGVAGGVAIVPIVGWIVANDALFSRPSTTTSSGFLAAGGEYKWREFVSYVWQFYLPRLPFMDDQFPHAAPGFPGYPDYPLWETYFQGLVGRFGWFQYGFPEWANFVALGIWLAIVGLFGRALWVCRRALRRRWPELLTYLAVAAGVLLLVAVAGYRYRIDNHVNFEQTRYLFPLLALYGALVAIAAARGARRLAPALGALLVVLAFGQNTFAALVTVQRYYDSGQLPEYIMPGPRGGQIRVQRAAPPELAPQRPKAP
jgi:4-amino-4-deoxy-L-arabinose transferase-like glycosyltransferase